MVFKTPPPIRPFFGREKSACNKMWGSHEVLSEFKHNFPNSQKLEQIVKNNFQTTIALHKSPTFYFRLIFLAQNRA